MPRHFGAKRNVVVGKLLATLGAGFVGGGYVYDDVAELPRSEPATVVPTSFSTSQTLSDTGNAVTNATNLQNAINTAAAADGAVNHAIILPAGAVFRPPTVTVNAFLLPARSGSNPNGTGWIVIKSAGSLPARGTRVKPSDAAQMPSIALVATSGADRCFLTQPSARHYWLMGLEVSHASGSSLGVSGLIAFGIGDVDQSGTEAHDLVVDRCYIHGQVDASYNAADTTRVARGVALNSGSAVVVDSWISEIHSTGQDVQAVSGWNGTGPYLIQNNHLEAAGENVVFGGADPYTEFLIPSDITIRGNHLYKPPLWWQNDLGYSVKNLFELKTCQRVLFENNLLENHWHSGSTTAYNTHPAAGQDKAINIKSNNQADSKARYAVRLATTANHALSGLTAIDGITPIAGDRVLAKNQTAGAQNGIYVAASGSWSRATDYDSSVEVVQGATIYVAAGTANGDKTYTLTTSGAITVGTTAQVYALDTYGYGRFQNRGQYWSITYDTVIRYNIVRSACGGMAIAGNVSNIGEVTVGHRRTVIHDNVFHDIGDYVGTQAGQFILSSSNDTTTLSDIVVKNNTFHSNYASLYSFFESDPSAGGAGVNLTLKDNIFGSPVTYNLRSGGIGNGTASLNGYWGAGTWTMTGNVLITDTSGVAYPSGNLFVADTAAIGFKDAADRNFDLATGSVALTASTTGGRSGADVSTLLSVISGSVIPATAPTNLTVPVISGSTQIGSVLSVTNGTWSGDPRPFTYTYQWKRAGSAISGAASATYTLVSGDGGNTITCTVTATDVAGSTSATSAATATITSPTVPANTVAPAITGTAQVGQTLTCGTGSWTGARTPTYAYQWKRAGTNISGATSSTYVPVTGDIGSTLTCTVTGTNSAGSASATASATASVTAAPAQTAFDPSNKGSSSLVLSNSNLTLTSGVADGKQRARSKTGIGTTDLIYFEFTPAKVTGGHVDFGICPSTYSMTGTPQPGSAGSGCICILQSSSVYNGSTYITDVDNGYSAGDVYGFAINRSTGKMWARRIRSGVAARGWNNNTSTAAQNPVGSVGGIDISSISTSIAYIIAQTDAVGDSGTLNTGDSAFALAAPSGYGKIPAP